MKKIFLILFITFSVFSIMAQKDGHKIEIKIAGYTGNKLVLGYHSGNKQFIQDTTDFVKGKAVFEGDAQMDGGIFLVILPPKNNYFEMIVADDQHFSLQTDTLDMVGNMKVKGSLENELFFENLKLIEREGKKVQNFQKEMQAVAEDSLKTKAITEKIKAAYGEMNKSREKLMAEHPDLFYPKVLKMMKEVKIPEASDDAPNTWKYQYYKKHYFDYVDFSDKRLLRTPVLRQKVTHFIDKVSVQHYDSLKEAVSYIFKLAEADSQVYHYFVVDLLNKFARSQIMCHDAVYVHIIDEVYFGGKAWWAEENPENTKKIKERANGLRYNMCGYVAPEMVMLDTAEVIQKLSAVEADFTILYFWSYDCGHCKKVTPKLAEFYPSVKDKNVALWTVSINGDKDIWKQKLKGYGFDEKTKGATHVQDHERKTGFDYYYDIRSTPRIFLLDKDKRILAKQISVEQLDDILKRSLKFKVRSLESEDEGKKSKD